MSLPTLSVLLPNYNHAHFIGRALDAILAQSVQPTEIIVVDDASTDDSLTVIESYARRHEHIRVFRNPKNLGVNGSLNRALEEATGEYIYGAAADDEVLPGFFERSLKLLAQYPQAGLCCSYPARMDAITGIVTDHATGWSEEERFFPPEMLADVMRGQAIAGHTAIVRRDATVDVGGWIGDLRWFTDWYGLQMVAFRQGACFIPASLALFRSSLTSYYSTGIRKWDLQSSAIRHLLTMLQSPDHADVLPLFRKSGVLGEIGLDAVRVISAYREQWNPELIDIFRSAVVANASLLMRDSEPEVRRGAATLLGEMGPEAWRSLPALLGARDCEHPQVCRAVCEAIPQLMGPYGRWIAQTLLAGLSGWVWLKRRVKTTLKPVAASCYRRVNIKLYQRLDSFEQALEQSVRADAELRQHLHDELQRLSHAMDLAFAPKPEELANLAFPLTNEDELEAVSDPVVRVA